MKGWGYNPIDPIVAIVVDRIVVDSVVVVE